MLTCVCKPPGWWGRLRLGIPKDGIWVCPGCGTLWKRRHWGYSDTYTWEKIR